MARLAYILAASHSGSTLLSMLLGAHPQIATVGEMALRPSAMGDLGRYRCSCGVLIRKCVFWQKVKESLAARGLEFDLARAGMDYQAVESRYARRLLGPLHRGRFLEGLRDAALDLSAAWRKQLPKIQRRNAALASTILGLRQAQIIVDSSKTGVRLKYLLRNPQLDVKIIHLIRDGRAVALTYMDPASFADAQDPSRRDGGTGGDRARERLPMTQAAYQWRRCNEEAGHLLRPLDRERWMSFRYEDLCTDLRATLRRLFTFLGLDSGVRIGDFRSVESHVVGNGMRFDTTSDVRLDERWRETLTASDLRTFDAVAGRMNRGYGYT